MKNVCLENKLIDADVIAEGSFILVRKNEDVPKELRVARKELSNSLFKTVAKEEIFVSPINVYPFRKVVEIDKDKYLTDKNRVDTFLKSKTAKGCSLLNRMFGKALKNRKNKLGNLLGVPGSRLDGLSNREVVDFIFENTVGAVAIQTDRKGTEEGFVKVTKSDFEEFTVCRRLDDKLRAFRKVVKAVESETYLPVYFQTTNYLKFDAGFTLLSFDMSISTKRRFNITNSLVKYMISECNESTIEELEVVNYSFDTAYAHLGILCKNEDAKKVLGLWFKVYNSCLSPYEDLDYYMWVDVYKNLGQENEESESLQVLHGDHFEPFKNTHLFTQADEKMYGLSVYR